jgi:hypothetical protein
VGGLAGWEGLEGTGLVVRFRGVGFGGGRVGWKSWRVGRKGVRLENKNKDEDGGAESGA